MRPQEMQTRVRCYKRRRPVRRYVRAPNEKVESADRSRWSKTHDNGTRAISRALQLAVDPQRPTRRVMVLYRSSG